MDVREPLDPRTLERLVETAASTDKVLVISEIGLGLLGDRWPTIERYVGDER